MTYSLRVVSQQATVGRLTYEPRQGLAGRYAFAYDPGWLRRNDRFPLSPHLPLRGELSDPDTVARFLANLLPEGRALEVAAAHHHIAKSNTFALIRLLGKEPVGALSFVPEDEPSPDPAEQHTAFMPEKRQISREELNQRIADRNRDVPFPVWDGRVRLSVAGFQDKLQVLVEGDRIALADGRLSSTHILKPESINAKWESLVANEHYCMRLAAEMGLPVAPVQIWRIPAPILLIQRFDRVVTWDAADGETVRDVRRLHVIDGCQAMDLPVGYKYERNFGSTKDVMHVRDGASFEKLFALNRFFAVPAMARAFMLRWALLNVLLGNCDAHGKNISFFVSAKGISPAPLYDLVSVGVYGDAVEQELAMAYGDEFQLEALTPFAMADFGSRIGVKASLLQREMTRMAQAATNLAPRLAESDTYVGQERELVRRIAEFVQAQARRMAQIATQVRRVKADLL